MNVTPAWWKNTHLTSTPSRLLPLSAVAGLVFGAADRLASHISVVPIPVAVMAGPWLAFAFALGACSPRRSIAAMAGALSLVGGILGYYGYMGFGEGQASSAYLATQLPLWLPAALIGGAAGGYAGGEWRLGRGVIRAAAAGLPCGVFAGEAIVQLSRSFYAHWPIMYVYVGEFAGALILPVLLVKGWRLRAWCYASTVIVAGLAMAASPALHSALRIF